MPKNESVESADPIVADAPGEPSVDILKTPGTIIVTDANDINEIFIADSYEIRGEGVILISKGENVDFRASFKSIVQNP